MLLLKVTINSTCTVCLLNVFFIIMCISLILSLLKYFVKWKRLFLVLNAQADPNEHYLNLFPELVRGMLTICLFTAAASRSFSLLSPFRSKHKVIVL